MRCNICGYEDDKQFSVCPYCGERITQQNNNVINNSINNSINSSVNSPINYNGDFGAIPTNPNINQPQNSAVTHNVLQTTQPKGFVRTMTGFKINHAVDDGEFYHRYIFFNILGILSIIIFFIICATNGRSSDGSFFILFLCFFLFMSFSSLINHIYSTLMNNFTFEVSPEGISVKSLMKQCFIPRNNIKISWFENISKMVDTFNYGSFFRSFFTRRYRRRGLFDDILFDRDERDNSDMFHNEKEFRRANNVFIEVHEPIFKNDMFASEDKKCLRLINTGLSFQSASEARFVDQEFKRVLGLPDTPVQGEYDYNFKTGKPKQDTRTPFDRN